MTSPYRQKRFQKAATTYHQFSEVQKFIALKLMTLWPAGQSAASILELGCGTGHLSSLLTRRFSSSSILLSDVSQAMVDACQETLSIGNFQGAIEWRVMDAAQPLGAECFDMLCSSTLVQWFSNLDGHLKHVSNALRPNGYYLFSGFSKSNFSELNQLLRAEPFNRTQFPGQEIDEVMVALESASMCPVETYQERLMKYYGSFDRFLTILHNTGASGRSGNTLSRSNLALLKKRYASKYRMGGGIQVTWRPWYILAKKK